MSSSFFFLPFPISPVLPSCGMRSRRYDLSTRHSWACSPVVPPTPGDVIWSYHVTRPRTLAPCQHRSSSAQSRENADYVQPGVIDHQHVRCVGVRRQGSTTACRVMKGALQHRAQQQQQQLQCLHYSCRNHTVKTLYIPSLVQKKN